MVDFNINVNMRVNRANAGLNSLQNNMEQTERRARSLNRAIRFGMGAASVAIAVKAVKAVNNLSESFLAINNRLGTVITNTTELTAAYEELRQVSNRTGSSFKATTELFVRVSNATEALGISQERVMSFVETVQRAAVVSGSTTMEAAGALRQLSQSLSSGIVRAEEWNSVVEQTPAIAQGAARAMGITTGELRKMVVEGELTSQVFFEAIEKSSVDIAKKLEGVTLTVDRAFTILNNEMINFIGRVDESIGISETFAQSVKSIALALEDWIKPTQIVLGLVRGLSSQLISLASDAIGSVLDGIAKLSSATGTTFEDIAINIAKAIDVTAGVIRGTFSGIFALLNLFVSNFARTFNAIGDILTSWGKNATRFMRDVFKGISISAKGFSRNLAFAFSDALPFVANFAKKSRDVIGETFSWIKGVVESTFDLDLDAGSEKFSSRIAEIRESFDATFGEIKAVTVSSGEEIGKTYGEAFAKGFEDAGTRTQDLINGILNPEEASPDTTPKDMSVAENKRARDLENALRKLWEIRKAIMDDIEKDELEQEERRRKRLAAELQRNKDRVQSAQLTADSLASIATGLAGKQSTAAKIAFGIQKAAALATAVVNIQAAIAQAATAGGLATAAAVSSSLAGVVSTIQGTEFAGAFKNGGSFTVGGHGGQDSQMVSFMATPGEQVTVQTPAQQKTQGAPSGDSGTGGITVVNVTDPAQLDNYINAAGGRKTLLNFIESNANTINSYLER